MNRPYHSYYAQNFYPRSRKGSDAAASADMAEVDYFYPRSRKGSDD